MYKFYGNPLQEVNSKRTGKILFRFDTKGEFITDDPEIIRRAIGFFDHLEMRAEPIGDKIEKTAATLPLVITHGEPEGNASEPVPKSELPADTSETIRHCKKCGFTCSTQGELLKHYRESHPKPKEE